MLLGRLLIGVDLRMVEHYPHMHLTLLAYTKLYNALGKLRHDA